MSQRHVDLLMEAVTLNTDDKYLCNRIGYICGMYLVRDLHNTKYNENDYNVLTEVIQQNIEDNLDCFDEEINTFGNTTFYSQRMTRKQWAKEVLAPLALALEEE